MKIVLPFTYGSQSATVAGWVAIADVAVDNAPTYEGMARLSWLL